MQSYEFSAKPPTITPTSKFYTKKIIWKRVGSIIRFCYRDNDSLGLDSTCFATGEK